MKQWAFTSILFCASLSVFGTAAAQDYPSRPITIIVPVAAGGVGDIITRLFANKVNESGKATIIVENRTGGAGVPGTQAAAKAAPDGYTLLNGYHAVLAVLPHLQKLPYDVDRDFVPIINFISAPNLLVTHPSVPASNVAELVAYARANPGKLTFASQGMGSTGHLGGELFKLATGTNLVHVPYRGAAPAEQDLVAGHVKMMFHNVALAMGAVQSKRVRALGVTTKERVAILPNVPTMHEQGIPLDQTAWFGLLAPAGTPPHIVAWLNEQARIFLSSEEIRKQFAAQGAVLPLGSPAQFGQHIKMESKMYADVIRAANIAVQPQ